MPNYTPSPSPLGLPPPRLGNPRFAAVDSEKVNVPTCSVLRNVSSVVYHVVPMSVEEIFSVNVDWSYSQVELLYTVVVVVTLVSIVVILRSKSVDLFDVLTAQVLLLDSVTGELFGIVTE